MENSDAISTPISVVYLEHWSRRGDSDIIPTCVSPIYMRFKTSFEGKNVNIKESLFFRSLSFDMAITS